MHEGVPIWWWYFLQKLFRGPVGTKPVKNLRVQATHNQIHHFQGIKRWKRDGKKKKMWTPPIPRQSQGIHKCGNVCGVQIFLVEVKFEIWMYNLNIFGKYPLGVHPYYHHNNNINLFLPALQLDRPVPRYKEDTETFIDHVQLWSATTRNHRCTFLSWLWFLVVYPRTLHNTMHVQSAPYFHCLYIYQTTFTKQHSIY